MAILHLEWAKKLKKEGERLGRAGLSKRVIFLVNEFNSDPTYKNAIKLAGRFKAISQACRFDHYWDEKMEMGFQDEMEDLEVWKLDQIEKPTPSTD